MSFSASIIRSHSVEKEMHGPLADVSALRSSLGIGCSFEWCAEISYLRFGAFCWGSKVLLREKLGRLCEYFAALRMTLGSMSIWCAA